MNQYVEKYFLILFSVIPISIIAGSSVSIINILLIVISFLSLMFYQKNWEWLFHPVIKLLFLLYLYLILNSFISLEPSFGIYRNLGFIRFIFLFAAFNYFLSNSKNFKFIFFVWFMIIGIVFFDVLIEVYSGSNILGYKTFIGDRVVSFFKDEPIVGGYLNSFYLIVIGFLFCNSKKYFFLKNNYFAILFSFIFLSLIILTGERSNGIKALFGFLIFYLFYFNSINNKKKIFSFFILFILFFTYLSQNKNLQYRYFNQIDSNLKEVFLGGGSVPLALQNVELKFKFEALSKSNIYLGLYKSGYKVFKNYPIFGVGNKNYRVESCSQKNLEYKYLCTTHPHQVYFEFLAEHGLIGTIVLLSIIIYLIFRNIKIFILDKNFLQIGSFSYLICLFIPFLPSGSFFNDYNLTLFWINFSILYASNPKTNIIKNLNYNVK